MEYIYTLLFAFQGWKLPNLINLFLLHRCSSCRKWKMLFEVLQLIVSTASELQVNIDSETLATGYFQWSLEFACLSACKSKKSRYTNFPLIFLNLLDYIKEAHNDFVDIYPVEVSATCDLETLEISATFIIGFKYYPNRMNMHLMNS